MEWRFLVKHLIFPPGGPLLLLLFSVFFYYRYPRLSRGVLVTAITTLWLFSTPKLTQWLAAPLETYPPLNIKTLNPEDYDAIVVLGGGREIYGEQWGGHDVSVKAVQRVRYAAKLAHATGLRTLTSGGLHLGKIKPSEAFLMGKVLNEEFALPFPILEEKSRTTWENATQTAAILLSYHQPRILLVPHAWHMKRSVWSYEQQGFEVTPAPVAPHNAPHGRPFFGLVPEATALRDNVQLLNEWAGLLLYPLSYRP